MKRIYGYELTLDLFNCNPKIIRSEKKLKQFVDELIEIIGMKKFGETLVPHFGHGDPMTSGYSLVQLIETSAITGHFSELCNSAYLNIFSCQIFDFMKASDFSIKFFKAKDCQRNFAVRGEYNYARHSST